MARIVAIPLAQKRLLVLKRVAIALLGCLAACSIGCLACWAACVDRLPGCDFFLLALSHVLVAPLSMFLFLLTLIRFFVALCVAAAKTFFAGTKFSFSSLFLLLLCRVSLLACCSLARLLACLLVCLLDCLCICLLLLAFACFCLLLRAFARFCLLLPAYNPLCAYCLLPPFLLGCSGAKAVKHILWYGEKFCWQFLCHSPRRSGKIFFGMQQFFLEAGKKCRKRTKYFSRHIFFDSNKLFPMQTKFLFEDARKKPCGSGKIRQKGAKYTKRKKYQVETEKNSETRKYRFEAGKNPQPDGGGKNYCPRKTPLTYKEGRSCWPYTK